MAGGKGNFTPIYIFDFSLIFRTCSEPKSEGPYLAGLEDLCVDDPLTAISAVGLGEYHVSAQGDRDVEPIRDTSEEVHRLGYGFAIRHADR